MGQTDMRLVGICKDCRKRLGVDERLTIALSVVQVSKLSEYEAKNLSGVTFPTQSFAVTRGGKGTTKITYKIAKTVKESIDDAASHTSHRSQKSKDT